MPGRGCTDENGEEPLRTSDGEIDWGAGEDLLSAEMKAEAFRIFAVSKFEQTATERVRPEMADLGAPEARAQDG